MSRSRKLHFGFFAAVLFGAPAEFCLNIICVAMVHLAITNLAACIALLVPITMTIASAAGVNPIVCALAVTIVVDSVILYPVQTAANLIAYASGYYGAADVGPSRVHDARADHCCEPMHRRSLLERSRSAVDGTLTLTMGRASIAAGCRARRRQAVVLLHLPQGDRLVMYLSTGARPVAFLTHCRGAVR